MKEPDDVMSLMSIYGADLTAKEQGAKNSRLHILRLSTTTTSFSMLLTIIMQRSIPQSVWRWYVRRYGGQIARVLAFLLTVVEVNAILAYKHFCKEEIDGMIGFRKLFSEALVCNPY